jgi:hypothetical protein
VFLNCCNGITLSWSLKSSLADAFAKRRVSVVVGTTERVQDFYATEWADTFYKALFSGESVGDSILQARREMLDRDRNPMALLYAFLGRYDARLPQLSVAA